VMAPPPTVGAMEIAPTHHPDFHTAFHSVQTLREQGA